MRELLEYIRDRWEWNSSYKDEIVLAVLVGIVSLGFALFEVVLRRRLDPRVTNG